MTTISNKSTKPATSNKSTKPKVVTNNQPNIEPAVVQNNLALVEGEGAVVTPGFTKLTRQDQDDQDFGKPVVLDTELDISKIKNLINNSTRTINNGGVAVNNGGHVTKADLARVIMKNMYLEGQNKGFVPARKDVISRLIKEAGLTQAGAATYLQNWKTKMGLVNHKA